MGQMSEAALAAYEGDVLAFISARLERMGEQASGLHNYYAYRVRTGVPLVEYEEFFLRHLADEETVFHAGIGIGTLTIGLANCGVRCVGFEGDDRRYVAAVAARDALLAHGAQYEIRGAHFPAGLKRTDDTRRATLLFTNVASGWSEPQTDAIIEGIHWFGTSYLDLRLFGNTRETEEERAALAERLRGHGLTVEPLAANIPGAWYVRVTTTRPAPPCYIKPARRGRKPLWLRLARKVRRWIATRRESR